MRPGSKDKRYYILITGQELIELKKYTYLMAEAYGLDRKIENYKGTRPIGFNAFWLRGTPNTLGILQDLGFIYHIDDISRDEPFTVTVNGKPFAVVPYTIRNNDIVRFDSPATTNAAYLQDLKDDFDFLYAEAAAVVE